MENHPIPQDITGFQFKLIGNMTIKQFAYLASGAILAWIFFVLPVFFLIKFPLALLSASIGAGLAFLPIEGRPMDVMVKNFFTALISPTQYVFQQNIGHLWFPETKKATDTTIVQSSSALSGKKLQDFLQTLPTTQKSQLDTKEMAFFQNLAALHQGNTPTPYMKPQLLTTAPQQSPVISVNPNNNPNLLEKDQEREKELQKETTMLQTQLQDEKNQEKTQANTPQVSEIHHKVTLLETQLQDMLRQKEQLEKEILELSLKAQPKPIDATTNVTPPTPVVATPQPTVIPTTSNTAPAASPQPAPLSQTTQSPTVTKGMDTPEFPNLVTGSVKDPRGNPLANILVEIKDSDASPVRAFKTNALGKFASATSLPNGNYTLSFEDPKKENKFDTISFTTSGAVITPFAITSMDPREELRRSLFNQ